MAGYMTKLQGYVYEGELENGVTSNSVGVAVENGLLLVQGTSTNVGKLVAPSADANTKLLYLGTQTIYMGTTAHRFKVNKLNANYYFVENGFEYNDVEAFDTRTYTTAYGKKLRAHPLVVGDEFVTTKITGTLTAGTEYGVKADGTIGAVSQ